jgi:hypothetical protein
MRAARMFYSWVPQELANPCSTCSSRWTNMSGGFRFGNMTPKQTD